MPCKIKSLYCQPDYLTGAEVEDGFKLNLIFEDGCKAYIEVGTYNFISMPRFYMLGKQGSAMITDWRNPTQIVECTVWDEQAASPVKTAAGMTKTMAPGTSVPPRPMNGQSLRLMCMITTAIS